MSVCVCKLAVTACNSRGILEGVLELDGEVNAVLELLDRLVFLHVPGNGGVAAGLVDGLGIAIRAVRPVGGAVCGSHGEWVWVIDGERDGDVAVLDAVDEEVCDLEGIA
jgi:1-aminocyclopropane-1-carboxylate deaminase/D-cysteine desulfhydrase-like pyridoxal-dependent ACC family enzyme